MPERTFRSPGFFEQEIDLSQQIQAPIGTPAGVIGTAQKGPAFVPVTVGSFEDFLTKFGSLDTDIMGPYAAREYLKHRNALTYMRVLGAGANSNEVDIETTRLTDQVKNAGFVVTGSGTKLGNVQFIVAKHEVNADEAYGMPIFSDNDSFDPSGDANLVRGVVFLASDTKLMVLDGTEFGSDIPTADDVAGVATSGVMSDKFKLVLSSSDADFGGSESLPGVTIMTASLNPDSQFYIGKILNKDPGVFAEKKHLLYLDFAVDDQIAAVSQDADSVGVLSGSSGTSSASGDTSMTFNDAFGHFNTRYAGASTPWIISQPFGEREYNLFRVESISDGADANDNFKISIVNLRTSNDPSQDFGTFGLQVRTFDDTDTDPKIVEFFPNLSLDPNSERYIARVIGDRRVYFNFDADQDEERRLVVGGKYPNASNNIRVVMSDDVEQNRAPAKSLPFGFRGLSVLKTTDTLDEFSPGGQRLVGDGTLGSLSGSIVPPLPFRFKVTRGEVESASSGFLGDPGDQEIVDGRIYWGVKFERNTDALNPNPAFITNESVRSYSALQGLAGLDVTVTGSFADDFNENKFSLARVALYNGPRALNDADGVAGDVTGSLNDHMIQSAYVRNGNPDPVTYAVPDALLGRDRITMATLLNLDESKFNRFSRFHKFNVMMHGGFDGLNILDRDSGLMNDRSTSTQTGITHGFAGGAASGFVPDGLAVNPSGVEKDNNAVYSYRTAVDIMTDPLVSRINLLAIPGIRDPLVTDHAADLTKEYGLALYLMDIEEFDNNGDIIFVGTVDDGKPSVTQTIANFETRAIDNSFSSTYFPDITIQDDVNNRFVRVAPSVAAMGAIAFNDKVGFPWFAPAGFNRGGLDFVNNSATRLNAGDRDDLYDARINPIATFPRQGFVIFGQKTLQIRQSALDRVNVRRMLLEIKRQIVSVADRFVFEQNTAATRSRFVSEILPLLAAVQTQAGIESFRVIMDETNNSQLDIDALRLNGKIIVVPTRAVEFISMDFIITNAGVVFE